MDVGEGLAETVATIRLLDKNASPVDSYADPGEGLVGTNATTPSLDRNVSPVD